MLQPGLAPLPRFRERPASQVHQPRTGSACNILASSPLRRVLRSSTGRPRSGVQVTSSGSLVPLRAGPPAQSNAPSPGSTPPLQGTARSVRFTGHAPGRPCNHCSPLRRVLRSSTGRSRSEARVTSSGSSGPLWARPVSRDAQTTAGRPWCGSMNPSGVRLQSGRPGERSMNLTERTGRAAPEARRRTLTMASHLSRQAGPRVDPMNPS